MDLQKTAECPVCLELFTEPKVLACGHCFCKKCINATPRGFAGPMMVTCPECRHESSVPAGGFPTNYRLLDIVSNLESAGFRNTKDCNGCGLRTPKAQLFSCTTCKEEVGDEQEIVICSLCFMNAHKAHDYVRYNKATQRDVDEARNKVGGDGVASQVRVEMVRTELHKMTQEVMQALEARAPKHVQIRDELGGALRVDASKDDIEFKVNQSSQHALETTQISLEMKGLIDRFGRQLKECIQKKGQASLAAKAKSVADQPSTSAAARPPREPTTNAWEHYFDHYGGRNDLFGWPPYSVVVDNTEGAVRWEDVAERNTPPSPTAPVYSPSAPLYSPPIHRPPTPAYIPRQAADYSPPSPPRASHSTAAPPPSQALATRPFMDLLAQELVRDQPPPPRDPRRQALPTASVMWISSDEEDYHARVAGTVRTRLTRKRARRDGDN